MNKDILIDNVSDTALWVAHYRAIETEKPDAIFKDPYAKILSGEKGKKIAETISASQYVKWNVITRTFVIDVFIQNLIKEGVDTIVNLGAGLDTRPYRMNLPANLRWIEVDYPQIINYKEATLNNEKPKCHLQRISLDLSNDQKRQNLFNEINQQAKNALILTEGVIPYLTEEQVANLAKDLKSQDHFNYWIAEYFAPEIYRYIQTRKRKKEMKNAPFLFFPKDWFGLFAENGWKPRDMGYLNEEGIKMGLTPPYPWWAKFVMPFMNKEKIKQINQSAAYTIYIKKV